MAVPTNVYTGIAKYPLIAIPMFVLVGSVFDRTGVALRLVRFATALVGAGRGALATVAMIVAMVIGGISGSGPATSAAVGGVVTRSMVKRRLSAPVHRQRRRRRGGDRHSHPAVDRLHHLCGDDAGRLGAGDLRGRHVPRHPRRPDDADPDHRDLDDQGFRRQGADEERPPLWQSFKEAFWGLLAPVVILGGMRVGAFTPTEAAVMAVFYGLFIGFFVYRTLTLRDVYEMLVEAGELSALILIVVALASVFAWATSTIGVVQPIATSIVGLGLGEYGTIALLMIALIIVGMFLDGVSTFLILLPVLQPIADSYGWDMVWFGVILTMKIAIGQFTPPLAVNLMVSCKIAQVPMESTIRWVFWMILAMFGALALVVVFPSIAMWLPRALGY